jgi:hypothetical protein
MRGAAAEPGRTIALRHVDVAGDKARCKSKGSRGKQKVLAVADGGRNAQRYYLRGGVSVEPGWVSLEPGWEVQGDPQLGKPVVSYKGVRMIF